MGENKTQSLSTSCDTFPVTFSVRNVGQCFAPRGSYIWGWEILKGYNWFNQKVAYLLWWFWCQMFYSGHDKENDLFSTCRLVLRLVFHHRSCCNRRPVGWSGRQSSHNRLHCRRIAMAETQMDMQIRKLNQVKPNQHWSVCKVSTPVHHLCKCWFLL